MGPAFRKGRGGEAVVATGPRALSTLTCVFPAGAGRAFSAPRSHGECGPGLGPSRGGAGLLDWTIGRKSLSP